MFVALAISFFSGISTAQTVMLPERWRFTLGDNPAFSAPAFNDSAWAFIDVPSWWENEGYGDYNGIGWYRTRFSVDKKYAGKPMYLLLGKIDDADEVWLNGAKIGATGRFPPDSVTAWNQVRIYKIPAKVLSSSNVLAVRVYDMIGAGGIVSGPVGLYNENDYNAEFNPAPGPRRSFYQLVTSNGLIAAVYNVKRGAIESVRPHIFQAFDSARFVQPFIGRIAPKADERPQRVFYRNNSHVIQVSYPGFDVHYFAPFTTEEKVFYAVVSGPRAKVEGCTFGFERLAVDVLVDSAMFTREGAGAVKYFLFSFVDSLHADHAIVSTARQRLLASNGRLLQDELDYMRQTVARCRLPKDLRPAERALAEQSIAVLKMAQVSKKEIFPRAGGQVLASLPPGGWNISWVRDGMYAIMGLSRVGLFAEARDALSFCLNAESSHYERFVFKDGKDYGVGVPYQISVTRYFGIGKEESDSGEEVGPNIELDGFGLYLIAFCDYVQRSGDTTFFRESLPILRDKVAEAIIHCIDTNDLIRADSGPWERHLPGSKQFAYTSIAGAAGLANFASLCADRHIDGAERYRQGSERLLNGIRTHLVVDNRFIKANAPAQKPEDYDYFDGGTFEAFGFGLMTDERLFRAHLEVYEKALRIPGPYRGFSRINKGDWYETAEWILLDLRIASAMHSFGEKAKARALLDWVTGQASLNFNLLPELYSEKTWAYDGAVPMAGFGAGAYILALSDLYDQQVVTPRH